jgi:hypothetical protein
MGGHSNQMFQYATAKSLAFKKNAKLRMDLSWFYSIAPEYTPRVYELGTYNLKQEFGKPGIVFKLKNKLGSARYYNEKSFAYDPDVFNLPKDAYLTGYFQSEKYFKDIRSQLLSDFSFKLPAKGKNATLLKKIQQDESSVSLHIRRGDYVSNPNANQHHGVKGIEYYKKALIHIKKTVKTPTLYVISNDPAWCKENLKLDAKMVFVDNNDDVTGGAEDMRLMRACRHNIMANSSFSWWGAWLNENPDKIVIAPKKWFNNPEQDTSDLLPDEWVKL